LGTPPIIRRMWRLAAFMEYEWGRVILAFLSPRLSL
jgi:hypothetical protein